MTLEELESLAKEAMEDAFTSPAGFTVVVPGLRYGVTCRLDKGLSGQNLGHYPARDTGTATTHVWLEADKVLKYVEKVKNV